MPGPSNSSEQEPITLDDRCNLVHTDEMARLRVALNVRLLSPVPHHASARHTAAFAIAALMGVSGCTETLDAGSSRPHGLLPVDERNPLVVINDGTVDNWGTEYAVMLANGGGSPLAGIIVGTSGPWPDLNANVTGARGLVAAAHQSGLKNVPDPIASIGEPLKQPASGLIDDTQPNRSEGALFIVDTSKKLALSYRPLVIATGGKLTDVADAYLIDHSVAERIVVVASLGTLTASGAALGPPNGEMDPWADLIVATRLRYVQVSAYYDQLADVPATRVSELPANAWGSWIASKQPNIWSIQQAADQVAVLAVGVPEFATDVERVALPGASDAGSTASLSLIEEPAGTGWLVRQIDAAVPTARFWAILRNPTTFSP